MEHEVTQMRDVQVFYLDGTSETFRANFVEVREGYLHLADRSTGWSSRYDVVANIPLTSIKKWK